MYTLFVVNGLYDILCALTLLDVVKIPILQDLHISMFHRELTDISKRLLGYWIMTYGFMRLSNNFFLIYESYILEILFILNETYKKNIIAEKAIFVVIFSLILSHKALYIYTLTPNNINRQ